MKFVIGWLKVRSGKRDDFVVLAHSYAATTLALEDGIEFFEFHPSSTDADTVIVIEKYRSQQAHDLHLKTAHFAEMWGKVQKLCVEARFENIVADRVEPDYVNFTAE